VAVKIMTINPSPSLSLLLENNKTFANEYENNPLMQLIKSDSMKEKSMREQLLDCIQVFSDYFQKVVMLRYVFCDNPKFFSISHQHLNEEYGHNVALKQDRHHRSAVWNPILEATSSWFAWKMLTLDGEEKTVLVHLVLETSAQLFFKQAHQIMDRYKETQYFKVHFAADEQHEQMGIALLQGLTAEKYQRLRDIQSQGWSVLNAACEQITSLVQQRFF
jgi:hypothetical protein